MRFEFYYFCWSIFLFLVELAIAIYIDDRLIRPYVGDVLVVILIYAIVRTFWNIPIVKAAWGVLIFSFLVEILQYFQIVEILGLGNSSLARVVIGTNFSGKDFIAYSVGFFLILCLEKAIGKHK